MLKPLTIASLPLIVLDMPKRPEWNYKMNKIEVEENEESMFRQYIKDIKHEHPGTELSYFEMNLEVLRPATRHAYQGKDRLNCVFMH